MEDIPIPSENELRRQAIEKELAAIRNSSAQMRSLLEINETRVQTILGLLSDIDVDPQTVEMLNEVVAEPVVKKGLTIKRLGYDFYALDQVWIEVVLSKDEQPVHWSRYLETFFSPSVANVSNHEDGSPFRGRGFISPEAMGFVDEKTVYIDETKFPMETATIRDLLKLAVENPTGFYRFGPEQVSEEKQYMLFVVNTPVIYMVFDMSRMWYQEPVVMMRYSDFKDSNVLVLNDHLIACC